MDKEKMAFAKTLSLSECSAPTELMLQKLKMRKDGIKSIIGTLRNLPKEKVFISETEWCLFVEFPSHLIDEVLAIKRKYDLRSRYAGGAVGN